MKSNSKKSIYESFILELIQNNVFDKKDFFALQRKFAKELQSSFLYKDELVKAYHNLCSTKTIMPNKDVEKLIRMKNTRSSSGIVVVSVLTKPYKCPGNCVFCPTDPELPKSYLSNEPAVMRAVNCSFDPYLQTSLRLKALRDTGHTTDKINIRVIGGTWSYYPKQYQTWFIKRVFQACNNFSNSEKNSFSLEILQSMNSVSKCRIVEISIETRQDHITINEIKRLRMLGVTKVELGVQSIYDKVLQLNNRGNSNQDTIHATKLLKDSGFKVAYQIMPNLLGATIDDDKEMFNELFHNSSYMPDHLKIYPLALVKSANIYNFYKDGRYKPYNKEELIDLLKYAKSLVPVFCRIERVIRDIPAESIVEGGSKISNLRQIISLELAKEGRSCQCIRCREVKDNTYNKKDLKLFRYDYDASEGREIFLSIESKDRKHLLSLLRLRIPSQNFDDTKHFIPSLERAAIIREMHTYGPQTAIGQSGTEGSQHKGYGKELVKEAETIALEEFKISKIAVISGVGVREYFKKMGYFLENTYMIKNLK